MAYSSQYPSLDSRTVNYHWPLKPKYQDDGPQSISTSTSSRSSSSSDIDTFKRPIDGVFQVQEDALYFLPETRMVYSSNDNLSDQTSLSPSPRQSGNYLSSPVGSTSLHTDGHQPIDFQNNITQHQGASWNTGNDISMADLGFVVDNGLNSPFDFLDSFEQGALVSDIHTPPSYDLDPPEHHCDQEARVCRSQAPFDYPVFDTRPFEKSNMVPTYFYPQSFSPPPDKITYPLDMPYVFNNTNSNTTANNNTNNNNINNSIQSSYDLLQHSLDTPRLSRNSTRQSFSYDKHHHVTNPSSTADSPTKAKRITDCAQQNSYSIRPKQRRPQSISKSAMDKSKLQSILQTYLLAPDLPGLGEQKAVIMTCKVAQKSYGTEKRFLCPPPTVLLMGSRWWSDKGNNCYQESTKNPFAPPQLSISISGEPCLYTGQVEWYSGSGILMGQTGSTTEQTQTKKTEESETRHRRLRMAEPKHQDKRWYQHEQEPPSMGRCVSKQLFITDADEKRKRVECVFKINLANGLPLGAMSSRPIKVISKPSKKKQSPRNAELCIHHGGLVSLFNRVRSQTVSTKYLGVSLDNGPLHAFPSQQPKMSKIPDNTCFVARTSSWDAFVVWIVDTNSPQDHQSNPDNHTAKDFIGPSMSPLSVPYPPPPAVALRNTTDQPLVVHYNQPIVLQCLRTGLVSPVMVIRKVDRASTVLGGARCPKGSEPGGGERGDEILGDPVSQLHRIALQIIQGASDPNQTNSGEERYPTPHCSPPMPREDDFMPRTSRPAAYLACLNDNVGMRQTTQPRKRTASAPQFTADPLAYFSGMAVQKTGTKRSAVCDLTDIPDPSSLTIHSRDHHMDSSMSPGPRKRMLSLNSSGYPCTVDRSQIPPSSFAMTRSNSAPSSAAYKSGQDLQDPMAGMDSYWSEDVSDAAIWTIVGTDCADYTFWIPPSDMLEDAGIKTETADHDPPKEPAQAQFFPSLLYYTTSETSPCHLSNNRPLSLDEKSHKRPLTMSLYGQHFTRDLQVWFGDIPAPFVEYRGRDHIVCRIPSPDELLQCICVEKDDKEYKVPIMLVRGDGVIHKTNAFYRF
ncbi:hypothetical protein CLU79DRAFT_848827 [Phycomyces nitens]|nr:hypothetical protein CLU79DRAFT_848827 [Phycomyces nitens]